MSKREYRGTSIALRESVELPKGPILYNGFNRHMKDIKTKTQFSMESTVTFFVYAIPFTLLCTLFYWSGASFNSYIIGCILSVVLSLWITYMSKEMAFKRTILESCFYFSPIYTNFLLSHPVIYRNIIKHLNFELLNLCKNCTSSDGTKTTTKDIRAMRREASEIVCEKIRKDLNETVDVLLVKSKKI